VAASFLFPLDDVERIVPASGGNTCLWSLGVSGVLGLFLGAGLAASKDRAFDEIDATPRYSVKGRS
jgi:hypothetical protein